MKAAKNVACAHEKINKYYFWISNKTFYSIQFKCTLQQNTVQITKIIQYIWEDGLRWLKMNNSDLWIYFMLDINNYAMSVCLLMGDSWTYSFL